MPTPSPLSFLSEELDYLKRHWVLFLIFGIALIVAGVLAIFMPLLASLSATLFIGLLLMIGGAAQIIGSIWARGWGAFFLQVLVGIIYFVTGLLMLEQPVTALVVLTILVAAGLLVGGLFRIVFSLLHRFPGWGWVLFGGGLQVLLGILIWRQLPESAMWVIGLFVGIDMLYSGITWVAMALSIREVPTPPSAPLSGPPAGGPVG